ncbi:MAG: hypothetical protein AB1586_28470 [Pseudomonadota bacterium]
MQYALNSYGTMRLFNQQREYHRFYTIPASEDGGSEAVDIIWKSNKLACAPVCIAMALREIVEASKLGFGNLKSTSLLVPSVSNQPVTPVTQATCFQYDLWDVNTLNFVAQTTGAIDANGNPAISAPAQNGNLTISSGAGVNLINSEFNASAAPVGRISYQLNSLLSPQPTQYKNYDLGAGLKVYASNYPQIESSQIVQYLNMGLQVILFHNQIWIQGDYSSNTPYKDRNGNPFLRSSDEAHAVVINGYLSHPTLGTVFRIYDPWGFPRLNPNQISPAPGNPVWTAGMPQPVNGNYEYVTLRDETSSLTTFWYAADNFCTLYEAAAGTQTGFGFPTIIRCACADTPPANIFNATKTPNVGDVYRIVVGFAVMGLRNDPATLLTSMVDDSTFCGFGTGVTNIPPPGHAAELVLHQHLTLGNQPGKTGDSAGKTPPNKPSLPPLPGKY